MRVIPVQPRSLTLALAMVALLAVGCRGGGGGASLADDFGRNLGVAAREFGGNIPEQRLPKIRAEADEIGQQLASSADRRARNYGDAKKLLDIACDAKDFAEGQLLQDISVEVQELAAELQQTDSGDAAGKLAVFALCNYDLS